MVDFILAAFPWVVIGIAIALAVANFSRKKSVLSIEKQKVLDKENSKSSVYEDNYMTIGMCLGLCLGSAFGSYGTSFGMLIGMVVGMNIKKI